MKIVGSGALNVDYFYQVEDIKALRAAKGLVPGAEVWGSREEFDLLKNELEKEGRLLAVSGGGSAANTIYALKSWGFETGFIGVVGEDEEGDFALEALSSMDLSRVIRRGKSGACLIILDQNKDRALFVTPPSEEKTLAQVEIKTVPQEWLHLSSLVSEEGFHFQKRLIKKHPGSVSLDPGEIYAKKGFSLLKDFFSKTKFLFLTSQELDYLNVSLEELKEMIFCVVLKKGKEGAFLFCERERQFISSIPPDRFVDNTGAGDVFDAGVLAGYFLGLSWKEAGLLAAELASLSLRDFGRHGFPTQDEFQQILAKIRTKEGF